MIMVKPAHENQTLLQIFGEEIPRQNYEPAQPCCSFCRHVIWTQNANIMGIFQCKNILAKLTMGQIMVVY